MRAIAVIRNAGEFEHFRDPPAEVFRDPKGRQVIGYYGAIADWFDLALVRRVAEDNPGALVVLVGHDTAGARRALGDLPNVELVGEVPYSKLPYWLHAFDVCMLPFRIIPLTLATNPVKLYEYLAAGKPVVTVDLPEMAQFGELVETAADAGDFLRRVRRVLATPTDLELVRRRQAFAAEQTWLHRADRTRRRPAGAARTAGQRGGAHRTTTSRSDAGLPHRSEALQRLPQPGSDRRRQRLQRRFGRLPARVGRGRLQAGHRRRLILNAENLGFAAGNNVGLAAATGELLVMLNNDTYATPGWVRTLCNHLRRDQRLGLVGPVTNNIGNEAKIDIAYPDMGNHAARGRRAHAPQRRPRVPDRGRRRSSACACAQRVRSIGGLDEAFGMGFFEGRTTTAVASRRAAGACCVPKTCSSTTICPPRSTSCPRPSARRCSRRNKAIFEAKWGTWEPHRYRNDPRRLHRRHAP
jgi:hypothetical protein